MEKGCKKVDTTFKKRRLIVDYLKSLEDKNITLVKMEKIANELLEMGKDVVPILLKNIENSEDEEIISKYTLIIEYLNYEDFINPLINIMLKKKNYNAVASILTTLRNLDAEEVYPFFYKLSSEVRNSLLFLPPPTSFDNEDRLILFIEEFLQAPRDLQLSLIKKYGKSKKYIDFLDMLLDYHDTEIVKAAIDSLGRIPHDKSYMSLNRIIKQSNREDVIKRAKRALLRLKFLGFDGELRYKEFLSPSIYKSYISYYDCEGNRSVWFARNNEGNSKRVNTILLIINDSSGIVDTLGHRNILKSDFDSIIDRVKEDENLVRIDYEYLLRLIRDAIYINYSKNIPLPIEFLFRKKIFYNDLLPPEPYIPSFENFSISEINIDKEMMAKMEGILDMDEFKGFIFENDKVYDYAREIINYGTNVYNRFYSEIIYPNLNYIERRLKLTADLMIKNGCPREKVLPVLFAGFNIRDYNNPFIKRLIIESLKNSINILKIIEDTD
jgi:hypothetical protein